MIRKFTRKFSISAPKLSVRPFVPWYVRWAIILPFLLLHIRLNSSFHSLMQKNPTKYLELYQNMSYYNIVK